MSQDSITFLRWHVGKRLTDFASDISENLAPFCCSIASSKIKLKPKDLKILKTKWFNGGSVAWLAVETWKTCTQHRSCTWKSPRPCGPWRCPHRAWHFYIQAGLSGTCGNHQLLTCTTEKCAGIGAWKKNFAHAQLSYYQICRLKLPPT